MIEWSSLHLQPRAILSLFLFMSTRYMTRRLLSLLLFLLALPVLAQPADTFSEVIRSRIDTLLTDKLFQRSHVGIYIYDATADVPIYEHDKLQTLRPASNMKVMTSAAALTLLGTDYNYQTRLYIAGLTENSKPKADTARVDSVPAKAVTYSATVYVRGGMDPLLDTDDLRAFAKALRDRGITVVKGNIVCDATFKDTVSMGWGWCWDDDYVPLTPFLFQGKSGTFNAAFTKALSSAGITFKGKYVHGRVPQGAQLLATRRHTIDDILVPMMKRSDNLFAESLFYQLNCKSGKVSASGKDAAAQVKQFIKLVGHSPENYSIADGSGLSLYNYLSAELLVDVLRYIYRHENLYAHLDPSLPVMGRDGTLSKRCIGTTAQDRVHAKTGTVRGVSALSGYCQAANGHLLIFSIINQGITEASQGRGFQDRVCQALTRPIGQAEVQPLTEPEPQSEASSEESATAAEKAASAAEEPASSVEKATSQSAGSSLQSDADASASAINSDDAITHDPDEE